MGLAAWARQWTMKRAIALALAKRTSSLVTTSGDGAKSNDICMAYLLDRQGEAKFLLEQFEGSQLQGKWSNDGRYFTDDKTIPTFELQDYQLYIQYYYRGSTFYSVGIPKFLLLRCSPWPWLSVKYDRFLQSRFNKRALVRQARIEVLDYVLAETVKDRKFQIRTTSLLTHLYSNRWVHRPDKDELMNYYTFIIEALQESGDLAAGEHGGYRPTPKALNTAAAYFEDERRHNDNKKIQTRIVLLTIALTAVGIVQAGAAAYEQWLKPPEVFTGTLGGQPIDLIQK
ncbi:hypothetical protein EFD56_24250 [Rhizobium phaseoli]|nr:hypothetical protein EFD56_24250 [Rhizobium phaseoli]